MTAARAIDAIPNHSTGYNYGGEGDTSFAPLSRSRPTYESLANVNVNGCFESDRVIKSGYVEKRTKTKVCTNTHRQRHSRTESMGWHGS